MKIFYLITTLFAMSAATSYANNLEINNTSDQDVQVVTKQPSTCTIPTNFTGNTMILKNQIFCVKIVSPTPTNMCTPQNDSTYTVHARTNPPVHPVNGFEAVCVHDACYTFLVKNGGYGRIRIAQNGKPIAENGLVTGLYQMKSRHFTIFNGHYCR